MNLESQVSVVSSAIENIVNITRLCYVEDCWAYFTTRDRELQWGDDWNDAPYEHNAGEPYTWNHINRANGVPEWKIIKVAFDGEFDLPCDRGLSLSVEQINLGASPWLATPEWKSECVCVPAWVTLAEFCELIRKAGGNVYMKQG